MRSLAKERPENAIERRDREADEAMRAKLVAITAELHRQLEPLPADVRAIEETALRETSIEYEYVIEARGEPVSHLSMPGRAADTIALALCVARWRKADRLTVTRRAARIRSSSPPYPVLEVGERVVWIEELHAAKTFPLSGRDRAAGERDEVSR